MWKVRKADTGRIYAARDLGTLQSWCRDGRVKEEDSVRSDQDADWRLASRVFDLAAHFPRPVIKARSIATGERKRPSGIIGSLVRAAGAGDSGELDIDLTSVMDMSFILLIFLMVVATPAFQHGMPLNLPQASTPGRIKPTKLTVSISKEGKVAVESEKLESLDQLREKLKGYLPDITSGKIEKVLLRADGSVQHQTVVDVMDVMATVGIKDISIATRPKELQKKP